MKLLPYSWRISKQWSGKYLSVLLVVVAGIFLSVSLAASGTVPTGLVSGTVVPSEVQDFVQAYLKDSTGMFSFNNSLREQQRIDSSLTLSDIEAGIPIHVYDLDIDKIKNANENMPISQTVISWNEWRVPIIAHGKYLYILSVLKDNSSCRIVNLCSAIDGSWESARTAWPESTGLNPVLITCMSSELFHFPQIDDYNLMTLSRGYKYADSVAIAFDESTGDNNPNYTSPGMKNRTLKLDKLSRGAYLSDSRRIFKHLKKRALGLDKEETMRLYHEQKEKEKTNQK